MANALLIQILNGLVYGGLLFIVSVGLVLIFGLRRVVNFAHGSLFMIGAYVGFSIATVAGFWAGVAGAAVVLAAAGVLLDVSVFRPLRRQDPIATVLVTFGLLLILEDLAHTVWGKETRSLPLPEMLAGSVEILGEPFPAYRLLVIAVAAAVGIALALWLRFSRIGLFVRASSVDPVTTAVQGVDTDRVSALVVAIGTGLAGLSGTIAAPLLALSPSMGGSILIESFIVVVVGGLGSFSGALIAALAIGQIHNLGIIYVPWAATMVPFLLMVAVLVWRPTGFAGSHV
ncbi:branched-chain amino acid ABC transporter permease [Azospirillum sp. HJ39]|uniref:branched-chain amino acid ABC transporter permease n=1 Tax=Azospirillum sp. HJ39 TaxID=3159496 RepID=UPI00355679E2